MNDRPIATQLMKGTSLEQWSSVKFCTKVNKIVVDTYKMTKEAPTDPTLSYSMYQGSWRSLWVTEVKMEYL